MMTDDDDDLYHAIVTHQWKRVDFHEQGATDPDIFVCKAGCTFPIPCVPTCAGCRGDDRGEYRIRHDYARRLYEFEAMHQTEAITGRGMG